MKTASTHHPAADQPTPPAGPQPDPELLPRMTSQTARRASCRSRSSPLLRHGQVHRLQVAAERLEGDHPYARADQRGEQIRRLGPRTVAGTSTEPLATVDGCSRAPRPPARPTERRGRWPGSGTPCGACAARSAIVCSPTVRPPATSTTRSAISSSSVRMWLDTSTATPSAARPRRMSRSSTRDRGSSPEAGSSSSSTRGRWISARVSARRCFCPRDSTCTGRSAYSVRWTSVSRSADRDSTGGAVHPVRGGEEGEVLADGELVVDAERVRHPTHLRPYAGRVRASGPTRPPRPGPGRGVSSEARISSRVVLPAPLGPTSAVT